MVQTSYLGIMVAPSGHRLVMQTGRHAFTTSAEKVTLTLRFNRVVGGHVSPTQATSGTKTKYIAAYLPYISTTQFTQMLNGKKLIVSRKTGSISALGFSYTLIGY